MNTVVPEFEIKKKRRDNTFYHKLENLPFYAALQIHCTFS